MLGPRRDGSMLNPQMGLTIGVEANNRTVPTPYGPIEQFEMPQVFSLIFKQDRKYNGKTVTIFLKKFK